MPITRSKSRINAEQYYQQAMEATNRAVNDGGIGRYLFGPSRQQRLNQERALTAEDYAQQQAQQAQMAQQALPGQVDAAAAMARMQGVDMAALSPAMRGSLGYNMAQQIQGGGTIENAANLAGANPNLNPAVAQQLQAEQAAAQQEQEFAFRDQQMQELEAQSKMGNRDAKLQLQYLQDQRAAESALTERQQKQAAKYQPLVEAGRSRTNIRDMKTLFADEGVIRAPGAARGAYAVMRGQLLNDWRKRFEAGALQQGDLEFLETLLPDAEAFMGFSQEERMAKLNELDYQTKAMADDYALVNGLDVNSDNFLGKGRSAKDILGAEIPAGFEETTPQNNEPATGFGFSEALRQWGF